VYEVMNTLFLCIWSFENSIACCVVRTNMVRGLGAGSACFFVFMPF